MDQHFRQSEHLKSRKLIQAVFREGKSLKGFPLLGIYRAGQAHEGVQVAFSVPKKKIGKAVHRNLIKRRMREAYRLNRDQLGVHKLSGVALMLIYVKNDLEEYPQIEKGIRRILAKLVDSTSVEDKQSGGS